MTATPALPRGVRTLPLMPAAQRARLDPYMAQIITYRKSGLSLNHVIGCPLDCAYCVRHFWGNFDDKAPALLCSDGEAVEMLTSHPGFRPHETPIQLLNKATDAFVPAVRPHLFSVLQALDARGYTNLVLIITRFTVTEQDMAELEALRHLRVTLLFTYSGITDSRIEPIASSNITVRSIRTACAAKNRTGVLLYWRPIVPGWNDSPQTMAHVLDTGQGADGIVFTGLYLKPENHAYMQALGIPLPYGEADHHRRKIMAADLDTRVIAAWRASGISTPLFRKTSCGVTYAHQVPDYNGHLGVPEICGICPAAQLRRCQAGHRPPAEQQMADALAELGHEGTPFLIEDGHVWLHGLDEQQRYPLQHLLRYQMWNTRQPHLPGAHGRSPAGYELAPELAAHYAQVRDELATEARYADDE